MHSLAADSMTCMAYFQLTGLTGSVLLKCLYILKFSLCWFYFPFQRCQTQSQLDQHFPVGIIYFAANIYQSLTELECLPQWANLVWLASLAQHELDTALPLLVGLFYLALKKIFTFNWICLDRLLVLKTQVSHPSNDVRKPMFSFSMLSTSMILNV